MPIPRDIERNLCSLSNDQWAIEKNRICNRSIRFYKEKIEKKDNLKKFFQDRANFMKKSEQTSFL